MIKSRLSPILWLTALFIPVLASAQETTNEVQAAEEQPATPDQQQVLVAALEGQAEAVNLAIKNGYDVNSLDPSGRTALMYASYNGHTPIVKKLLEAGAKVNIKDQGGSTALMFASSGPFKDTVILLLDKGAEINAIDNNEHFTALMWAAAEGQAEIVKLLLEHGADITLTDIDGDTAESFASKAGKFEVAQILKAAVEDQEKPAQKEVKQ